MTAMFLLKTEIPKFCQVRATVEAKEELTKKEKWISEKKALDTWGEKDLWAHCESG